MGGVLGSGQRAPFPSAGGYGERCKLPQRIFGFWSILGPQKSRQNGQLTFESGGEATSESGGHMHAPLPQCRTVHARSRALNEWGREKWRLSALKSMYC